MVNIDSASETWRSIEEWANDEIARLREINDNDLDPAETSSIRGGIKTLKNLLALAEKPAQKLEVANTSYID